ncbi:MAG: hypothetical protein ACLPIX_22710 [Rhodomicrobium sp.]
MGSNTTAAEPSGWIVKGPFACFEGLYKDVHGDEKVGLAVRMHPRSYGDYWPKKWYLPDPVRDNENLPMLCWREFDARPYTDANAGINWAPRACFVWYPSFENQPPLFVSVNMDWRLPKWLSNIALAAFAGVLYLIGCAVYLAHYCLSSDKCSGWGFHRWTLDAAVSLVTVPTVLTAAGLLAYFVLIHPFIPLRSATLINLLVSRLIWRGLRGPIPNLITPKVHVVPWTSLEGFHIVKVPKDPEVWFATDRIKIRATFGRDAPATDIMNGTCNEETAQEMLRLLTSTFIDKRQHYRDQLAVTPRRSTRNEAQRLLAEAKELREIAAELDAKVNGLTGQITKRFDAIKRTRAGRKAAELRARAHQLSVETMPLAFERNEMLKVGFSKFTDGDPVEYYDKLGEKIPPT